MGLLWEHHFNSDNWALDVFLTLSQMTNFIRFQTEKVCRRQFQSSENTLGKGEIACYKQFLLFPQCFQKTCTADKLKPGLNVMSF